MEILGIIPARGGSKGIPNKNVVLLSGRPLITYTCDAVHESKLLTRVVLSTDDDEIAAIASRCDVDIPFVRPAELARDDTPMINVILHALDWLRTYEGYNADIVMLLQPTSPLRRGAHIDAGIQLLLNSNADTVVSVIRIPHHFVPNSVLQISEDGLLTQYLDEPDVYRRQDKPVIYARNGPAILVTRPGVLARGKLYGDIVRPLVMMESESIDLDTPEDLKLAEFWLDQRSETVLLQSDPLQ